MIKLVLLIVFCVIGMGGLRAESVMDTDQEFLKMLGNVKNPFEDGIVHAVKIVKQPSKPKPRIIKFTPKFVFKPVRLEAVDVVLPALHVEGVFVGKEMHWAIINDQPVVMHGSIQGARIESIEPEGVGVSFRGKRFFVKVE